MQHCAHIAAYYKRRANGNLCEDALAAMFYEMALAEMIYEVQRNDETREATAAEMRRAVLIGTRVKIDNEGNYGYLYKGELYVPKKES